MTPFSKNLYYVYLAASSHVIHDQCHLWFCWKDHCPYVFLDIEMISSYLYSQNDSLAKLSIRSKCKFALIGRAPHLKKQWYCQRVEKFTKLILSVPIIPAYFKNIYSRPAAPESTGAPNDNFRKNICLEDDLRSKIFGTFFVKFLACLPLLAFSNI